MAKQDDFIKTQIRIDPTLYNEVKKIAAKNNHSINETMNMFIHDALYEIHFSEETAEVRRGFIDVAVKRMNDLSNGELQAITKLCTSLSQLRGN